MILFDGIFCWLRADRTILKCLRFYCLISVSLCFAPQEVNDCRQLISSLRKDLEDKKMRKKKQKIVKADLNAAEIAHLKQVPVVTHIHIYIYIYMYTCIYVCILGGHINQKFC